MLWTRPPHVTLLFSSFRGFSGVEGDDVDWVTEKGREPLELSESEDATELFAAVESKIYNLNTVDYE